MDNAYAGVISGSGDLTKTGNGTLTLSGTSDNYGDTIVRLGTFNITSDHNIGAGTNTLAGGTLKLASGTYARAGRSAGEAMPLKSHRISVLKGRGVACNAPAKPGAVLKTPRMRAATGVIQEVVNPAWVGAVNFDKIMYAGYHAKTTVFLCGSLSCQMYLRKKQRLTARLSGTILATSRKDVAIWAKKCLCWFIA
ncbi:hypothetical protein AGMMS49543_12720 [Betaproteobacteria bacterium]|nr:hypothetical protein AGMMS49543_12720 [Betaproteobacteria bacterium]GHU09984.1 hypothetical protein AGMMS50225_12290 [Betaproteobacteria bacterium]